MSQTETNCRNSKCVHFFVRRERMVEANQTYCMAGVARPQYQCKRFEPVVVRFHRN